jgi:hypothetical protein
MQPHVDRAIQASSNRYVSNRRKTGKAVRLDSTIRGGNPAVHSWDRHPGTLGNIARET